MGASKAEVNFRRNCSVRSWRKSKYFFVFLAKYNPIAFSYMSVEVLQSAGQGLFFRDRKVGGEIEFTRPGQRAEDQRQGEDLGPAGLEKTHLVVQAKLGET